MGARSSTPSRAARAAPAGLAALAGVAALSAWAPSGPSAAPHAAGATAARTPEPSAEVPARSRSAPAVAGARGDPRGLALRAAKALIVGPEGDGVVDGAVVLVRDGKIEAIGPARELSVPEGYEVVDCGSSWLVPGYVDLHCHIAGQSFLVNDINDMVYLANPELRASSAVAPDNPMLRRGVAGGVTTVLFIPGSGTNMGGQGVLLKTGFDTYERMEVRNPGSLKLAQAGNPERWTVGVGRSLMNWNTRGTFRRGLSYAKRWREHEKDGAARPEKDIRWEVFRDLLEKRTQVSTHTQMYQVVLMTLTMVRQELGLDVYIDHGEFAGAKTAAFAQELGVQAIVGPREIDRTIPFLSVDTDGRIEGIAAGYQKAGHTMVGFNTDSPIVPEEELPVQATVSVRYGFDNADMQALRGLTIVPAKTAGIGGRVGSLAPGKDADILVVNGDPIDPRNRVDVVFIEGERVYDASREPRRW